MKRNLDYTVILRKRYTHASALDWKARVEFLLSVIELLFLSLTVEALQGKMCQNSLPLGGVGHLQPKFQGHKGRPPANILIPEHVSGAGSERKTERSGRKLSERERSGERV